MHIHIQCKRDPGTSPELHQLRIKRLIGAMRFYHWGFAVFVDSYDSLYAIGEAKRLGLPYRVVGKCKSPKTSERAAYTRVENIQSFIENECQRVICLN